MREGLGAAHKEQHLAIFERYYLSADDPPAYAALASELAIPVHEVTNPSPLRPQEVQGGGGRGAPRPHGERRGVARRSAGRARCRPVNLSDKMIEHLRSAAHGSLADRFEIGDQAGAGGMGIVYRATDRESGGEVALKVLRGPGASAERFEREAAILERLDHPAIVDYVAHGITDEGEPWLAMEWLEGVSLSDRLRAEAAPLTIGEVLGCAVAVTGGLVAAHSAGIIHRDLKPSNLFLVGGRIESPKILDFGVARLRSGDGAAELTQTGQAIGTPGYMAPEQIRGAKDADARADLFSLGCVIYRMLTERPAFEGDDVLSVIAKLALTPPTPLEELVPRAPRALATLVHRLMAKSPEERPGTARAVQAELEGIHAHLDDGVASVRVSLRAPDVEAPTELANQDHFSRPSGAPTESIGRTPGACAAEPSEIDVAPASTLPSSTEWRAEMGRPRRRVAIGAGLALLAVVAGSALLWTRSGTHPLATTSAPSGASEIVPPVPSATTTAVVARVDAPDLHAEARASAMLACRAWSGFLAQGQKADGSFAMEKHRKSSGWDTGQQLTALVAAAGACGGAGRLSLGAGAAALAELRHDGGWSGPGSPAKQIDSGSASWVVLALASAREIPGGDTAAPGAAKLDATLADAEKGLLGFERSDGSFRFVAGNDVSNDYLSVLGTWALVEAELEADRAARPRAHPIARTARRRARCRAHHGRPHRAGNLGAAACSREEWQPAHDRRCADRSPRARHGGAVCPERRSRALLHPRDQRHRQHRPRQGQRQRRDLLASVGDNRRRRARPRARGHARQSARAQPRGDRALRSQGIREGHHPARDGAHLQALRISLRCREALGS